MLHGSILPQCSYITLALNFLSFYSHANKTHFQKGLTCSLVLKVRVWNSEAKKWPIKLILIVHLFTLVTLSATSIQVLEASDQLFQKYIPVEAVL